MPHPDFWIKTAKVRTDVIRSLPVFLPIALMHFWIIASKLLSAERVKTHELLYAAMVIGVTVLTFTPGIYLTILFVSCVMLVTLSPGKRRILLRPPG